jgi:iron-sulfur cluster assembly accessory protein
MSTSETETVTFTERGAEKMQEVLAAAAGPDMEAGLRIDVVSGGCSGFQYRLVLDEPTDADLVFEDRSVRILVDREHLAYVRGASVDYADDADGQRFRVDNPNVVYGCGCGSSFVLREDTVANDSPRM